MRIECVAEQAPLAVKVHESVRELGKITMLVTAHAVTLGLNNKINDILNKNESVNLAFVCLGHGMIRDQHQSLVLGQAPTP
jgi:hypothetical protein